MRLLKCFSSLMTPWLCLFVTAFCFSITAHGQTQTKASFLGVGRDTYQVFIGGNGSLVSRQLPSSVIGSVFALTPNGKFLYNVPNYGLMPYRVSASGDITPILGAPLLPEAAFTSICIHPSGRFLYALESHDQEIWQFRILSDGRLEQMSPASVSIASLQRFSGTSIHISGSGRHLLLFSYDRITPAAIGPDGRLRFLPEQQLRTDTSFGHEVFHPTKDIFYVLRQSPYSLVSYRIDERGTIQPLQTDAEVEGNLRPNWVVKDMVVDPSGTYLYCIDDGQVVSCRINEDGTPSPALDSASAEGSFGTIVFSPDGRFAYLLENDGLIAQYRVQNGRLESQVPPAVRIPGVRDLAALSPSALMRSRAAQWSLPAPQSQPEVATSTQPVATGNTGYSVTTLGLMAPFTQGQIHQMNSRGQIVGIMTGATPASGLPSWSLRGFLWENERLRPLTKIVPYALNSHGDIAGKTGQSATVVKNGKLHIVSSATFDFEICVASGINTRGNVLLTKGAISLLRIDESGRITNSQALTGFKTPSMSRSLSEGGDVLGELDSNATIAKPSGEKINLSLYISTGDTGSSPTCISESGNYAVGVWGDRYHEKNKGFVWNARGAQRLEAPEGFDICHPDSVNDRGVVVGTLRQSRSNQKDRAFIYINNNIVDLNTWLPPDSGWLLTSAKAINNPGWIAGEGWYQGQLQCFLLRPAKATDAQQAANPRQTDHPTGDELPVRSGNSATALPIPDSSTFPPPGAGGNADNNMAAIRVMIVGQQGVRVALVPVAVLAQGLGATVERDGDAITARRAGNSVTFVINSNQAMVNGRQATLSAPAHIIDGQVYAPVGALCAGIGARATINSKEGTIHVISDGQTYVLQLPSLR